MGNNVFVTGPSGYIGSHVAEAFVRHGAEVSGLVRSDAAAAKLERLGIRPVPGELANPPSYLAAARQADMIVHLGFEYDSEGNEVPETDRVATRALLSAGEQRARSLIYTSSLFRYRAIGDGPLDEDHWVPREPDDWRCALEREVLARDRDYFRTAVIRLGWVYGGGGGTLVDALRPIAGAKLPASMLGNRIPLVHIEDVADLYLKIAMDACSGLFHACRGQPKTLGALTALARPRSMTEPTITGHADHFADIFRTDLPAVSRHDPTRGEQLDDLRLRAIFEA